MGWLATWQTRRRTMAWGLPMDWAGRLPSAAESQEPATSVEGRKSSAMENRFALSKCITHRSPVPIVRSTPTVWPPSVAAALIRSLFIRPTLPATAESATAVYRSARASNKGIDYHNPVQLSPSRYQRNLCRGRCEQSSRGRTAESNARLAE